MKRTVSTHCRKVLEKKFEFDDSLRPLSLPLRHMKDYSSRRTDVQGVVLDIAGPVLVLTHDQHTIFKRWLLKQLPVHLAQTFSMCRETQTMYTEVGGGQSAQTYKQADVRARVD